MMQGLLLLCVFGGFLSVGKSQQKVAVGTVVFPAFYDNEFDRLGFTMGTTGAGRISPLCGHESFHNNNFEDRRFKWGSCAILDSAHSRVERFSTLGGTTLDGSWARACPGTYVLVSVASGHDNGAEDREFKFGCAEFEKTRRSGCSWTSYLNSFDGAVNFRCTSGKVFAGVRSFHSNAAEDRRFSFLCCDLVVA